VPGLDGLLVLLPLGDHLLRTGTHREVFIAADLR